MADNPVLQQVKVAPTDKMVFTGTFEGETKQDLIITNTTDRVIAFKLKGTSPEIMKQRPGYGYINAKDKVAITVRIASLKEKQKLPGKQRITVMLAEPPADKPPNAFDFWKSEAATKNARREIVNMKFKRKIKKKKASRKKGGESKKESKKGGGSKKESKKGESKKGSKKGESKKGRTKKGEESNKEEEDEEEEVEEESEEGEPEEGSESDAEPE